MADSSPLEVIDVARDRDTFFNLLVGHLASALQDVVGLEDAAGFISIVGQRMGDQLNTACQQALAVPRLDRRQVAQVLVDFKQRIAGDFYVVEQSDDKIVLGNRACPFGENVRGRPALCMMTSNLFGVIAAENLGYANVVVEQAIARGAAECRVVIYLDPANQDSHTEGREYFRTDGA